MMYPTAAIKVAVCLVDIIDGDASQNRCLSNCSSNKTVSSTNLSQHILTMIEGSSQKLAFSYFLSQFYELAFLTKCWLFQTRNPPLSLFLAFLAVVFSQFRSNII